jgi:2-aminobenzoylacetyl-CoA thioesterase
LVEKEVLMILDRTGKITDGFYLLGLVWSPIFLMDGEHPFLFEAGFACGARFYHDDLVKVLADRHPEILFITHVHWDHCGTVGYFKSLYPSLKIAASKRASEIVRRPNAIALMEKLTNEVVPHVESIPGIDKSKLLSDVFRPFAIDTILHDGQILIADSGPRLEVIATPGHTRDHLSYYFPEKGILIATEAAGGIDRAGSFITEFMVDYDGYIANIKRLASLEPEIFCQGHHFVYVGKEEVAKFFSRSLHEAERFRDNVYQLLDEEEGSVERVVKRVKSTQWDTNTNIKQAEGAYLLNLRARITHLAEKQKAHSKS